MTASSKNIVRAKSRTYLKNYSIFMVTSHFVRRIIWVFLLLFIFHLPLVASAFAQTSSSLPAYVSTTSPLYTDLLVNNLFHSFSCLAIGQSIIGAPCLTYQVTKNAQGMIQGIPVLSQVNTSGGALGATTSLIGMLYQNPPVRTADYLASLSGNFGVVRDAHAQVVGSGAQVLNPILKLWQVSRNISYVLLIIIFLVIGLMVMFRNKLNPQTVITAQTALPGLVIGLIMITFSFFLAGLISDMAFVGTNMVGYYFSAVRGQTNPPQDLVKDLSNHNILSIVSPFTGIVTREGAEEILTNVWGQLSDVAKTLLTALASFITFQMSMQATEALKALPKIGELIQLLIAGGAVGTALLNPPFVLGMALSFIATAILIYAMFKLLLRLINNYLTIIFLTVTAPFQLLFAALPGRQGIATDWIMNILANILAFPAVVVVLYFVAFLLSPTYINDHCKPDCPFKVAVSNQEQNSFITSARAAEQPPGLINVGGGGAFPLFGNINISFLNVILAFGALMALPSIPDIIGRAIGRMSQTGQMIGQEIGGSIAQGRGYAGQFQQGIAGASQQGARARGLFSTPGYKRIAIPGQFEADGTTPKYRIVETYEPGRGATFGTLSRKGIVKPPKLEPGVKE